MIVQLIGIKCVQICEAVWAESRTQITTPIRDGRTDTRTHRRTHAHESYVPRSGHLPRGGQKARTHNRYLSGVLDKRYI